MTRKPTSRKWGDVKKEREDGEEEEADEEEEKETF